MGVLLDKVNDYRFNRELNNDKKMDVIQRLIQKADLFERGSIKYHTPLNVSHKYFCDIENKEQALALI